MVARRLGFSRPGKSHPYRAPADLVGLRGYAKVSAERSRTQPELREIEGPPAIVTWNRSAVLDLRCRHKQVCPNGWTHPCHQCAIGYETCAAATHYLTLVVRACPECRNPEALTDPEDTLCLECTRKQVLQT